MARAIVNAAMIYLAAQVVPGIALRGKPLWPALLAGLVLALINAVVRPVIKIITLPLTLLTLGLFLFVLNAFCLWLTSAVVPGFDVHGFRAAFLGALLITVVSWALTVFVTDSGRFSRL
ncbi:MAG TPA: phage holin family protein [Methylomirabilota bacterium]